MPLSSKYKRPESVLVIVHTRNGNVLLLKRIDLPEFWQSVTGALHWDEAEPYRAALREVEEETGIRVQSSALRDLGLIRCFPILAQFRDRYDPQISHNVEHAFALELPTEVDITLSAEHTAYTWLAAEQAVGKVASWSNREAIEAVFAK